MLPRVVSTKAKIVSVSGQNQKKVNATGTEELLVFLEGVWIRESLLHHQFTIVERNSTAA